MQTKISSLRVSQFTVFEENLIEFSTGVNVFIGKNGTGKTHLLKILYSLLKSGSDLDFPKKGLEAAKPMWTALSGNFKVQSLPELHRQKSKGEKIELELSLSNSDSIIFNSFLGIELANTEAEFNTDAIPECIYIPPQEMLSWFNGFTALWDKREIDFDQTYYQLAKALELPLLKNGAQSFSDIVEPLEKIINAKIYNENGRFYLEYEWGKIEIHLVAEGFRKLATIIYLLANGSINSKTILFWDEPEVHFNPSVIEALVALIQALTNRGIQIFITTHDYLLSQRLSLIAEYESPEFPIKFFCLENEKNKGVTISEGRTLAEIETNPILNEFAEYYDFERIKYKESLKNK